MKEIGIAYDSIEQISKRDKLYAKQSPIFKSFIHDFPTIENFKNVIERKATHSIDRSLLVKVLLSDYSKIKHSSKVKSNIEALKSDRTFTVVTAHQPSLLTGPLYYIYKIISTINITEELSAHYPNYTFVPCFVSGGEDHDFEEVNHCHLFGKKIEWSNNEKGAVGRFSTYGLNDVIDELNSILGEKSHTKDLQVKMKEWVTENISYGTFQMKLVNELFGNYGVIFLNMDNSALKQKFSSVITKEILEKFSAPLIQKTQEQWKNEGLKPQAHAREINFFYLKSGIRERILSKGDIYSVNNSDIKFTKTELLDEISIYPERFSPNVVTRPLYQETILPNLAYVGGGGELAYWMERKSQFEAVNIPFPILIRRNSALIIETRDQVAMDKVGLNVSAIFNPENDLVTTFLKENLSTDISLDIYKKEIQLLYKKISESAMEVDPSLKAYVLSNSAKQDKIIDQIEQKIRKSAKEKESVSLKKIHKLKTNLFPDNGLQERSSNIFQYISKYGLNFIDKIKQSLPPLSSHFSILLVEKDDFQV